VKPAIQIKIHKDRSLSQSFFGGRPKLPKNFDWPNWNTTSFSLDKIKDAEDINRQQKSSYSKGLLESTIHKARLRIQDPLMPLKFLGQIYLSEIPRYGNFPNLPPSGVLCFFWDALLYPPGGRASSKSSCRVVYLKEELALETLPFPSELIRKYEAEQWDDQLNDLIFSLSFEPKWSLPLHSEITSPSFDRQEVENAPTQPIFQKMPEDSLQGFPQLNESNSLSAADFESGEAIHMLFGHPVEIQSPMEVMCQLCFHGFDLTDYNANFNPETFHLKEGVQDWQLLLQLDSDDNLDWMWGDSGMLYFWIRKQDLEKEDFSNVWCEMQCC
jgi:uncharacterized protein YwqG